MNLFKKLFGTANNNTTMETPIHTEPEMAEALFVEHNPPISEPESKTKGVMEEIDEILSRDFFRQGLIDGENCADEVRIDDFKYALIHEVQVVLQKAIYQNDQKLSELRNLVYEEGDLIMQRNLKIFINSLELKEKKLYQDDMEVGAGTGLVCEALEQYRNGFRLGYQRYLQYVMDQKKFNL